MANIKQYVHFRDTPDVDGLCPVCFNPALKQYVFQELSLDGITQLGTRIACTDCHKWTEPLQPYKELTP